MLSAVGLPTALLAAGMLQLTAAAEPSVAIVVSGGFRGRVEGCDCPSGLSGGLAHRAELLQELFPDKVPPGVDCGGILDLDVERGPVTSRCAMLGLSRQGLRVLGVTSRDMFYGERYLRTLADSAGVHLVSANLVNPETGELLFERWNIIKTGDVRVAVTALTEYLEGRRYPYMGDWTPLPYNTVTGEMQRTIPTGVDGVVLLTDIGEREIRGMLDSLNWIDVVVTSSRRFYTQTPLQAGGATVVKTQSDGRAVEWLDLTPKRDGLKVQYHSLPVLRRRGGDRETVEWLRDCLSKP